jgi:hypothetical protein
MVRMLFAGTVMAVLQGSSWQATGCTGDDWTGWKAIGSETQQHLEVRKLVVRHIGRCATHRRRLTGIEGRVGGGTQPESRPAKA